MNSRAEPPVQSIGTNPAAFTQFYRTRRVLGSTAAPSPVEKEVMS
jgi:hypothetical protein